MKRKLPIIGRLPKFCLPAYPMPGFTNHSTRFILKIHRSHDFADFSNVDGQQKRHLFSQIS